MEKWVLITGASKGIGFDFAHRFAKAGDNLVLVARSLKLLEKSAQKIVELYGVKVEVIAEDLSLPSSAEVIVGELAKKAITIHTLVNNAGIGAAGEFGDHRIETIENMSNLNMLTLTKLTYLLLSDMKKFGGAILNVASTASFQPGPFCAVYYATKAYVLSFSEALHQELKSRGIAVSCLCPGPTETDFFKGEGLKGSNLEKLPWMQSSKEVAEVGFNGLRNNKAIAIPGFINWLGAISIRFTPRFIIRRIVAKLNLASVS